MKGIFAILLALAVSTTAFAQGKVTFGNDANHLVVVSTDTTRLPSQWVSLAGRAVPQSGTGGGMNLDLFTVELLAGTTADNLRVVSSGIAGQPGLADGRIPNRTPITLIGIPAGTVTFFQVRLWETAAGNWETTRSGFWPWMSGSSPVFTCVPGAVFPTSIVSPVPPANSTWAPAPIELGFYGCLDPWLAFVSRPSSLTVTQGSAATFSASVETCPSPWYQWLFNGVAIPGATNSSYQILSARSVDAGTYSVIVSNYWVELGGNGWTISASATLTVLVPPTLAIPPVSQTAEIGANASFSVQAQGDPPLGYRWFFNSTPLTGATNSRLDLVGVQPSQAGAYTVVITNLVGAVTSPPAMLSVITPVERRPVPAFIVVPGDPSSALNIDTTATPNPGASWALLAQLPPTNALQWYFDQSDPVPNERFYRAWQAGSPTPPALQNPTTFPAIKLSYPIGKMVRLDYINMFGPTDAWVTLATVTMTNTTQDYLDAGSFGQPPRLYRIVPLP